MKKVFGVTILMMAFAFVPVAMAQDYNNGGASNAPAAAELPTLSGTETAPFEAANYDNARQICDQVASANHKAKCDPVQDEANPQNVVTYHCVCE